MCFLNCCHLSVQCGLLQITKGDAPAARDGHCAIYDNESNRLVIFGGRNQDKKRLNDTHFLDLEKFAWQRPQTESPPSPREHSTCTIWAGHMLVFGRESEQHHDKCLHRISNSFENGKLMVSRLPCCQGRLPNSLI